MRLLILSILCCSLFVAGCRKNGSGSNSLLGKWTLVATANIGSDWREVSEAEKQSFEFRSDSTYTFNPPLISSLSVCNGTFRTNAELMTLSWTCQQPAYEYLMMYSVNGNTLTLDYVATSSGFKAKYVRN